MKLTSGQLSKIKEALLKKGINQFTCNECKETSFQLDLEEWQLLSFQRNSGEVNLDSKIGFLPVAVFICNNCGAIKTFSLFNLIGRESFTL